jgi:hypothetical protein
MSLKWSGFIENHQKRVERGVAVLIGSLQNTVGSIQILHNYTAPPAEKPDISALVLLTGKSGPSKLTIPPAASNNRLYVLALLV